MQKKSQILQEGRNRAFLDAVAIIRKLMVNEGVEPAGDHEKAAAYAKIVKKLRSLGENATVEVANAWDFQDDNMAKVHLCNDKKSVQLFPAQFKDYDEAVAVDSDSVLTVYSTEDPWDDTFIELNMPVEVQGGVKIEAVDGVGDIATVMVGI